MGQSRQQLLIEILHAFLVELGEPIHYKELTQLLIDAGAWEPYGSKPDQIVYSAMHQDLRRRGDWSVFRLVGPGVFCTSETKGVEAIAREVPPAEPPKPRLARRKKGDTEADFRRRLELASSDATCGNCALLTFEAAEEYRQRLGSCGGWPESGRHCARVTDEPCHLHRRMTAEAHEARQARREELLAVLVENGFAEVPRYMYDRIRELIKRRGG